MPRGRSRPAPALTAAPEPLEFTPLGPEGCCPACGGVVWSGGPPTEGEFPLHCRGCGAEVPRP